MLTRSAPLRITLLGSFAVLDSRSAPLRFRSDKVRALLAYLVLEPRPHSRPHLAVLLWPDQPDELALRNLSQTLVRLRDALGDQETEPPFLLITRHAVEWNPTARAEVDAVAVAQGMRAACRAERERAVAHYGALLPGFNLPDSAPFEEWLALTREQLERLALETLDALADAALADGAHIAAEAAARRVLAIDPWREAAHRQVMQALAARGERAAALAQYSVCRRVLFDELGIEPDAATTALYDQIRAGEFETRSVGALAPRAERAVVHLSAAPASPEPAAVDWGDAPELGAVYGRSADAELLARWLDEERCRLVAVVGMGGQGKTTLATQVAEELAPRFEAVVWRSALNAPPLEQLLADWLRVLAPERAVEPHTSADERLELVMERLRARRCLLILDNLETLLNHGGAPDTGGSFPDEYAGYARLLRRLGQGRHMSCLLLTSREEPAEVARLAADHGPVRTLQLGGLAPSAGQELLAARGLQLPASEAAALVECYSGNALALRLVAQTIRELFAGDVAAFLAEGTPIFDDIRAVLDQQWARLSALERELLTWLAIEREPTTLATLQRTLVAAPSRTALLEALRALQRRALLELHSGGFVLQNVVIEDVTARVVDQLGAELEAGQTAGLQRYALLKADAKEYVRQSQGRLLLDPVAQRLLTRVGPAGVDALCRRLLDTLRAEGPRRPGYGAGNLLNLLIHLGIDLAGYDFSALCVWQAYLQEVNLAHVSLPQADFTGTRFPHTFGSVQALAYSPDGRLLAAGTSDGRVHTWQIPTRQLDHVYQGHARLVWAVCFSPDGALLASASGDYTVRLWDVRNGQVLHTLYGHTDEVTGVCFSPDGRLLASSSWDRTLRVWEVHGGRLLHTLDGKAGGTLSVAFHPRGELLASATWEPGTVQLWDIARGRMLAALEGHSKGVKAVCFSPDGTLLASAGMDHTVQVWDADTCQQRFILRGHTAAVKSLAFSHDSRIVASGGEDQTVRLWDTRSGHATAVLHGHRSWVEALAFSPADQLLASGGRRTVRLWDARSGQPQHVLHGYMKHMECVAWSPDGTTLASGSWDQRVRVWDVASGELRWTGERHRDWVTAVAYSPDGALLASASNDQTVRLWNSRTGTVVCRLEGHSHAVRALAWSPDGRLLATGGIDATVRVWEARSGRLVHVLREPEGDIEGLAFSPSGALLACSSSISGVYVWRVGSWDLVPQRIADHGSVYALAYHPEYERLFVSCADMRVRVWDFEQAESIEVFQPPGFVARKIAVSASGALVATIGSDETVSLWDAASGALLHVFHEHTDWTRSVAFSPDGDLLASASFDETVKLWDVRRGVSVRTLRAPGPYDGTNIAGATGLTEAQRATLLALGAVEAEHL